MKTARWLSAAVMGVALLGRGREAGAQQQGFALDQFDPAERGSDWFAVESLDLRGNLRPAIGVVMDGAYRPLAIYAPGGAVEESVVRNQVFAHAGASLVLWDRLRVGFNLPVAVFQDGHNGVIDGVTYAAPPTQPAVGDLRLGADLRIVGVYGDPFTLALGARAYVPTGSRQLHGRWQGPGRRPGRGRWRYRGLHLRRCASAANTATSRTRIGGSPIGSQAPLRRRRGLPALRPRFHHRARGVRHHHHHQRRLAVREQVDPGRRHRRCSLTFARDFRLGGGVGLGLTRGYGSPEERWLASLEWAPAYEETARRQATGMTTPSRTRKTLPDVPGVETDDPKTNGCPPTGITTASRRGRRVSRDGGRQDRRPEDQRMPARPGWRRRRRRGRRVSGCTPGVKTDDPKTNGCPPDRDHDGVLDGEDACPDTPGLKTDDPKTNGCPDPDRDKDGIPNESDACPDVPGPTNPDPKKNGCPQAYIQAGQIKIRDQVKFATASAAIVPGKDSQEVLDAVAEDPRAITPRSTNCAIEGHTDNTGTPAYNRVLSQHRAESVMKWLVKRGVAPARLTAQGFGPDRPIDDNSLDSGRRNNRRVEFHIVGEDAPSSP